jgi:hypothetical protein
MIVFDSGTKFPLAFVRFMSIVILYIAVVCGLKCVCFHVKLLILILY